MAEQEHMSSKTSTGRPSSDTGLDPQYEDPGGGIVASAGALDEPPPEAAAAVYSKIPVPDEARDGAQPGGMVSNYATAAAAALENHQSDTRPKVRDSGLGTSAVSESVLEVSMRLMRDNPSAQEQYDYMMQAVHCLETAVREKRVSDVRRQRKEILPLRRGMEHGFLQNVQGWPAVNRQAMLGHLSVTVEGVTTYYLDAPWTDTSQSDLAW
jgi:hypothetical protein